MADNDSIRQRGVLSEKSVDVNSASIDSNGNGFKEDTEYQIGSDEPKLKRKLKARHLQMIAIGT